MLGGLSRTLAAAASTESGEEDEASLVEAVTAEADIAQDISSELASDMHSAASMLDEQSYYSATSSLGNHRKGPVLQIRYIFRASQYIYL